MPAPSQSKTTVIVFGATGAIGTTLIEIIARNSPDWKVLAASRSGGSSSHLASLDLPKVELIKANIEDLQDAKRVVTEDVNMVFSCIGFDKYETKHWAKHWPIVISNLLEVTSSNCPLIFCDNLYAYGVTANISTETPTVEPSLQTKFGIRAMLRETYFEKRMEESPGAIAVVGGADFFGPRSEGKGILPDFFVGNIVNGQKPMAIGSATVQHDFCSTRDFANALYTVASSSNNKANATAIMGRFWICPHAIKGKSLKQIARIIHNLNGTEDKGVQVLSPFMVSLLGIFVSDLKNLKEMMPWWTRDYGVEDSEFCKTFDVEATPMNDALQETIEYYKAKKQNKSQ